MPVNVSIFSSEFQIGSVVQSYPPVEVLQIVKSLFAETCTQLVELPLLATVF